MLKEIKNRSEENHLYYLRNRLKIIRHQKEYAERTGYYEKDRTRQLKSESAQRMTLKYPEKYKARNTARNALASGKLIRQPCEVCGSPKSEIHHDEYSKPLEVRWLCHMHHRELEGRLIDMEAVNGKS